LIRKAKEGKTHRHLIFVVVAFFGKGKPELFTSLTTLQEKPARIKHAFISTRLKL
jgi:hypothetical protein